MKTEPAPALPDLDTTSAPTTPTPGRGGSRGFGGGMMRALLVLLLGFGGGLAGFWAADEWWGDGADSRSTDSRGAVFQPTNDDPSSSISDAGADDSADDGSLTPREVYARVSPAVVHIDARVVKEQLGFFGMQEETQEGTGSGFLIDDEGHIVTNAHVVENAEELTVALGADNVEVPAELIGADRSSDIAVIKVDPDAKALDGVEVATVPFADSTKLQVGDPVLAIGNPFGLDRTLTTGVVSALQREIPSLNDFRISDVIQTDAAINPGNSGGPLLDAQGRVIGVNSQIQTRSGGFDGVAFAVPSERVKAVAEDLIKDGEVSYAWLGVAGGEITPELVEEQDLPVDEGVLLGSVTDGSPADKAGLRGGREVGGGFGGGEARLEGGDIILSFDGTRLESMNQLAAMVDEREPGDKVKVTYLRDGDRRTTTVTLGERPNEVGDEG